MMKKIMFVCTGNVCRSPMAHYYMQKRVNELGLENDFLISSCGTQAIDLEKATTNAILSMEQYGVDLTNHRATNMIRTDIETYDMIVCLTIQHKQSILYHYPKLEGKVKTLKEFCSGEEKYLDIDDPWGFNQQVYQNCAAEIVQYVDKLLDKLKGSE